MKFVVKDIKITLRTDSGETVVVEESCDEPEKGRAKDKPVERKAEAKPVQGRKAETKPAQERKAEAKPAQERKAEAKPAKARSESAEAKAPAKKTEKASSPASTQAEPTKPRSLVWRPHTEFGYNGFAAKDGRGTYKVLKSISQKWGLLYDQVGVDSVPLGCYQELDTAQKAAQQQHDLGMPDRRKVPQFCPADAPEPEPEPAPAPVEAAPAPTSGNGSTLTPEMRAEMMSTMQGAIRTAMENVA